MVTNECKAAARLADSKASTYHHCIVACDGQNFWRFVAECQGVHRPACAAHLSTHCRPAGARQQVVYQQPAIPCRGAHQVGLPELQATRPQGY